MKRMDRRNFIELGASTASVLPLVFLSYRAQATINADLRVQFKYQDKPLDGKSCTTCLEFVLEKGENDRGRCKIIPGDDEISANGYCTLWNTM